MSSLVIGIPSKGRLMEATEQFFSRAGLKIDRSGADRGYRGRFLDVDDVEVAFLSASEIARHLRDGTIDAGVTGEDLLRETFAPDDESIEIAARLDFGLADVVVAVPCYWLDCDAMSDLDDIAQQFYARHKRRLRVATKYRNMTRRFFAAHGVTGYRIVESLGATEGAPASGTADVIVDITTTGDTLRANQLKMLRDGTLLNSTAVFAVKGSKKVVERLNHSAKSMDLQLFR
jgi:ATP phosphoribosyltransferase